MDFENLQADLTSYKIEGFGPQQQWISLPLISHIRDGLYVGGWQGTADLGDFFTHVYSFFVWGDKYRTGEATYHEAFHMYDGETVDVETIEKASDDIVKALEDESAKVLVHCQAGMNRSNVVSARVLMKKYGMTADEAIALLRKQRGEIVLANPHFEAYLKALDDA